MIKKDKSFDALRKNCTKTVEASLVLAQQKKNIQNGITLVALIIIIIVLLILATVSINLIVNGGILDKAKGAVDTYSESEIGEQIKLAYAEWQTAQYSGTTENENEFIKNRLNNTLGSIEDVNKTENTVMVIFLDGRIYTCSISTGKSVDVTNKPSISKSKDENFVGCYADIDADGIADGVIFADLLVGNTKGTRWWDNDGQYNILIKESQNLRDYCIITQSYDGIFGKKNLIATKNTQGDKRFYVMKLNDVGNSKEYFWYKNAKGKMSPLITSGDFGRGEDNTNIVLNKWNNGVYGTQDDNDMWKYLKNYYDNGWFVPSRAEWSAFANELGINKTNYKVLDLKDYYWSSSQYNAEGTWFALFSEGFMGIARGKGNKVDTSYYVRLATTF